MSRRKKPPTSGAQYIEVDTPSLKIGQANMGTGTITLEEYRRRMVNATRPLTDSLEVRPHQGVVHRILGGQPR